LKNRTTSQKVTRMTYRDSSSIAVSLFPRPISTPLTCTLNQGSQSVKFLFTSPRSLSVDLDFQLKLARIQSSIGPNPCYLSVKPTLDSGDLILSLNTDYPTQLLADFRYPLQMGSFGFFLTAQKIPRGKTSLGIESKTQSKQFGPVKLSGAFGYGEDLFFRVESVFPFGFLKFAYDGYNLCSQNHIGLPKQNAFVNWTEKSRVFGFVCKFPKIGLSWANDSTDEATVGRCQVKTRFGKVGGEVVMKKEWPIDLNWVKDITYRVAAGWKRPGDWVKLSYGSNNQIAADFAHSCRLGSVEGSLRWPWAWACKLDITI
jgi:hypothetical protein